MRSLVLAVVGLVGWSGVQAAPFTITTTPPEDTIVAIQAARHGQTPAQIVGSACSAGLVHLQQLYRQADEQVVVEELQQMEEAERQVILDLVRTRRTEREQRGR